VHINSEFDLDPPVALQGYFYTVAEWLLRLMLNLKYCSGNSGIIATTTSEYLQTTKTTNNENETG
jgi:hypothetical protein